MKRLAVLWLFAVMLVVSCDMNGGDDGSKETIPSDSKTAYTVTYTGTENTISLYGSYNPEGHPPSDNKAYYAGETVQILAPVDGAEIFRPLYERRSGVSISYSGIYISGYNVNYDRKFPFLFWVDREFDFGEQPTEVEKYYASHEFSMPDRNITLYAYYDIIGTNTVQEYLDNNYGQVWLRYDIDTSALVDGVFYDAYNTRQVHARKPQEDTTYFAGDIITIGYPATVPTSSDVEPDTVSLMGHKFLYWVDRPFGYGEVPAEDEQYRFNETFVMPFHALTLYAYFEGSGTLSEAEIKIMESPIHSVTYVGLEGASQYMFIDGEVYAPNTQMYHEGETVTVLAPLPTGEAYRNNGRLIAWTDSIWSFNRTQQNQIPFYPTQYEISSNHGQYGYYYPGATFTMPDHDLVLYAYYTSYGNYTLQEWQALADSMRQ
jgi:hypothetical protein